jgi:hypothetical protein
VAAKASVSVSGTNLVMRTPAELGSTAAPYDLSTAGDTQPRNTANCYIINGAGYYKLPLVYGNAIKNGIDNTPAYNNTGGTLSTFLNHAGDAINSPYINQHAVPADAIVVWMDSPGLVTNPRLVGNGIFQSLAFDVEKETVAQGNAVVAVRDAGGTILWSWHIWAAHPSEGFDASNTSANTFDMESANATYKVMKSNIGWVCNTMESHPARKVTVKVRQTGTNKEATFTVNQTAGPSGTTIGRNPYFQWGRKDPMPSAKTNNTTEEIELFGSRVWTNANVEHGSITEAIKNPDIIYGTGSFWYVEDYYNLWSATETKRAYSIRNDKVTMNVKTIYDPSPVGFRVPVLDVFDALDVTNFVWYPLNGYNVRHYPDQASSYFLPATGMRVATSGALTKVGTEGYYWTAFSSGNDGDPSLTFDNTAIAIDYATSYPASTSRSIRPVVDADPIIGPPPFPVGKHAAPGVIGYFAQDGPNGERRGELTLRGSSAYAGTEVDPAVNPRGDGINALEQVPVFVALFKFGSLIAVTSMEGDKADAFNARDVVKVPEDYDVDPATIDEWSDIPVSPQLAEDVNITSDESSWENGLGDPCGYYFGNQLGGGWRLPMGGMRSSTYKGWNEGTFGAVAGNGQLSYSAAGAELVTINSSTAGELMGMRLGVDDDTADWRWYLPVTGERDEVGYTGSYNNNGLYWSSTSAGLFGGIDYRGYFLTFTHASLYVYPSNAAVYEKARAVRCVKRKAS